MALELGQAKFLVGLLIDVEGVPPARKFADVFCHHFQYTQGVNRYYGHFAFSSAAFGRETASRLRVVDYEALMTLAIAEAKLAGEDVPVGALLVSESGEVVATGHNQKESGSDPTAHAEIVAIRKACKKVGDWRLENLTLVVTLEPCVMCAGAIVAARIPTVVFGAFDDAVGAAGSHYDVLRDSRLGSSVNVISGVLEEQCAKVLRDFFESRRS